MGSAFGPALELRLTQRAILVLESSIHSKGLLLCGEFAINLESVACACTGLRTNQIELGEDLVGHLAGQHGHAVTRVWGRLQAVHHLQAGQQIACGMRELVPRGAR